MHRIPLSLLALTCAFGAEDPGIAPFLDNKTAALSFIFDDGRKPHASETAPILEQHGYRATVFPILRSTQDEPSSSPKSTVSWKEWKDLVQRGHEVGNHTIKHPNLTKCDDATLEQEVCQSATTIAFKTGVAPVSFAYPFCKTNAKVDVFVFRQHLFARGYTPIYEGTCSATKAKAMVDDAIAKKSWLVYLSHGIDSKGLEEHLCYLDSQKNTLWIAPYGVVGLYQKMKYQADLKILERTATSIRFSLGLKTTLPLTQVLTLRIPTGTKAEQVIVEDAATSKAVAQVQGQEILVNLVPDSRTVTIRWSAGTR